MRGRLGIYDKRPFEPLQVDPELSGVLDQAAQLRFNGGNKQQERMIKDKRRSLDRAVWHSYQAAEIVRVDADFKKPVRALINPNKLKMDYDDKILSVGFEYNFKCGDVFEWLGTKTHWLIYLQDLTELAYFRGDIRRCTYQIKWQDEDGEHATYAAVRGPVETAINSSQKHGIILNTPNHSLNILMPQTEETLNYFKRYTKFYLQGLHENAPQICWRVAAIDWISSPGIIEVSAIEYYANETEDDVDNGIVGGLLVEPESPNEEIIEATIVGETFIKPKKTYSFTFAGEAIANWTVDKKYPVELSQDGKNVQLKWTANYSGQFELVYGDVAKTIVVESLF